MAALQRTTTSARAAIAQAGLLNSMLQKLRPLILKKGLEVGAEYGLKGWHFGDVGEAGILIDGIVLDGAKIETLAREWLGLPYEMRSISIDSVIVSIKFKDSGASNELFFSEMRAAGRRALELAKERADAVLELDIVIDGLQLHLTPRSVRGAEAAAEAWEAAAASAAEQPGMDGKLLLLLLERTTLTFANMSATFDIYDPFETEAERGPKLAVEEMSADRMRFRNVVTRSNLQLAQSGGAALSGMKTSVLKKLAQSEGLDQAAIDATDDEEDATNTTLVKLISDAMAASKARPVQEGVPPDP